MPLRQQMQFESMPKTLIYSITLINFNTKQINIGITTHIMGIDQSTQITYKSDQTQCYLKASNRSSSFNLPLPYIQVEANTSEKIFHKKIKEMQSYLTIISQKSKLDIEEIKERFWLPFRYDYYANKHFCSHEDGRAILKFESGYETLYQQMSSRSFNNDPFTISQLWKLLYVLSNSILLFKNSLPNFVLNSDYILVNSSINKIKFSAPLSEFQKLLKRNSQNTTSFNSFLFQDNINKKDCFLFSTNKRNQEFDLGVIMAECLLLQSFSQIYQQKMNQQFVNHNKYQEMIKKILKNKLYPIKIKLLIVGLLQLQPHERFTCQQLYKLLYPQKNKIVVQEKIHLHKSAFSNCFGSKLVSIEEIISQVKVQYQREKFKKGVITLDYRQHAKQNCKEIVTSILPQSKQPFYQQGSHITPTQSLNFSLSNIIRGTKKGEDTQSLVWSKSQMRSTPQQHIIITKNLGGISDDVKSQRNKSSRITNNPFLDLNIIKKEESNNNNILNNKQEIQNIFQELCQEHNQYPIIKKTESQNIDDKNIQDIFTKFAPENNIVSSPYQSKISNNATPIFHKIDEQQTLKEIEQRKPSINYISLNRNSSDPSQNFIKQKYLQQKQLNQKQSKQIPSIQNILTPSIKQIKLFDSKPRIPIYRRLSQKKSETNNPITPSQLQNSSANNPKIDDQKQNSQVAQYKSYLYQVQPLQLDINTSGIQFKEPEYQNPSELRQMFLSQSNQFPKIKEELFLQKTPQPRQNMYQSCKSIGHNKGLKTGDSIIQGLTNLMSSTKSQTQFCSKNDTPLDLIRQSTKKEEYMSSFKKYSPQLIAQLNLRSLYPQDEKFKRSIRQKISINEMAINKSRQLFPEHQYPLNKQQAI